MVRARLTRSILCPALIDSPHIFFVAQECIKLVTPSMALFSVVDKTLTRKDGREELNENGLDYKWL